MKRFTIALIAAAALPLLAQQAANGDDKIVATLNGETITQSQLDRMYNGLSVQMRGQYEGRSVALEQLPVRLQGHFPPFAVFTYRVSLYIGIQCLSNTI